MALIKCSECGNLVSDKAKACPNCGCPIEQENESGMACPECGQTVTPTDSVCPNCGYPLENSNADPSNSFQKSNQGYYSYDFDPDEGQSNKKHILIWVIVISFVAIAAFSLYFFSELGYFDNTEAIDNTSVIEDTSAVVEEIVPEIEVKEFWEDQNFEQNCNEVERSLSEKAKNGDRDAMRDLGMSFLHPEASYHSQLKREPDIGLRLLEMAANKNDVEAQIMLSGEYFGMYKTTDNVDYEKGKYWLLKAGNNGSVKAMDVLIECYFKGTLGFESDYEKYTEWLKRKHEALKNSND